jgi:acetyl-CoA acyltransferase
MREAVIVEAVRSPFGRRNGSLKDVHPVDLSADVLNALVARTGVDPALIDDVIWGCVTQLGDQSSNIGRFAVLAAGWPEHVPGVTINRACGSSQQALEFAVMGVMSGQYDLVVAGGAEVMTRVPLGAAREFGFPYGPRVMERYDDFSFNQGISAEKVAEKWGLSRLDLDEFSVRSHEKAAAAIDDGSFARQIVPIETDEGTFEVDECVRRGTSVEVLAGLKPSFVEGGLIHAGNSSQISDGAAALMVTTPERAAELGLQPIVRYHSGSVVGADPILMLTGPIAATEKVLDRSGVNIDEIGAFEVNEAFSPVPLAWMAELGVKPELLNPVGGAIALGHPLGATGAGLATRLIHHMRDHDLRYGIVTVCEGGGTANATLLELVS